MRHYAFAAAMGFATAVLLASASQSQAASADPTGYWVKPDAERESKIQVFKCGSGKKLLCAKIAWLKEPLGRTGQPLTDIRNENASLRNRQIVGLTIFTGLAPSAPSTWTGKIYNPEDGKIYSATLTVLSRSKILLKGCKAWLLCGERHWLRTSPPPEELKPAAPVDGTEQIEASVTPPAPSAPPAALAAAAQNAEPAVPDLPNSAPAPQEVQTVAAPAAQQPDAVATVTPVALVTEQVVEAAAPAAGYNWQRGYGFLSLPNAPDTAEQLSGENVSSMMVMAKPVPTEAGTAASEKPDDATAAVPMPQQKPKVAKPKPMIATAAASGPPAAKPAAPKTATQAAPAPQDANAPQAAVAADGVPATTAEAAMVEEAPLSRRQRRMLRRQQHEAEPFLPWLR
jgi:uncharacterized protein (DUF2147 family)